MELEIWKVKQEWIHFRTDLALNETSYKVTGSSIVNHFLFIMFKEDIL